MINVYFKGIITLKPFTYLELKNVNAYYGEALISTYQDEKELKGFGLYIDKSISNDSFIFEKIDFNEKYDYILTCGPTPMMEKLVNMVKGTNTKLFVSLENHMACGVGACLVCTCKTKFGNKKTCKDGPVFRGEDVIFNG